MPRVQIVSTNFTAGELTPKMMGRVDVARYANGAKEIENAWPILHGGIDRRWGTRYEAATKVAAKRSRLIPFIFNRTQAYILEFGDFYMRVFKPEGQVLSGGVPFEIATPYSADMLPAIDYTQGADTMFLWHQGVFPQRLRRLADDKWVIDAAPFNPAPFDEIGYFPPSALAISDPTVGAGRVFSPVMGGMFFESDVGRSIVAGTGVGVITGLVGSTATVTISTAFDATSFAQNDWQLTGSPQTLIVPSASGPVGAVITLESPSSTIPIVEAAQAITGLSWSGTDFATATVVAHGYSTGDTVQIAGCLPAEYNGTWAVFVTDADNFTYNLTSDPGAASALGTAKRVSGSTIIPGVDTFRSWDVGSFVRINGGLTQIIGITTAQLVSAVVLEELTATVGAPANAWTLESSMWSASTGYPGTGTFFQQRLIAAGSPAYPQNVWGSAVGEYFVFQLGTNDDDAFAFELASDNVNPILYVAAMETLVCMTYGGEFTIEGGVEKPVTPTNVRVKPRSNYGSAQVRPVRVGNEELFVQRTGRSVRAIGYTETSGTWAAPDMSVLAEHLVQPGVSATTWQDDPGKLVFAVREDGQLATATYDRDQDVVGWARQNTDGAFESVATIPAGDGDQTWAVVRRTIDGATVRYVESFDPDLLLDAAITGTHPTGAATWTGLAHLNGKVVDIVADGAVMPRETVAGGQITLPRNAKAVQIGLPYTSRLKLLTPEVNGQIGSAQGSAMDVGEIYLRVQDTVGVKVNGQILAFRQFGAGILDQPPEPFTGLKRIENLGWADGESPVEITQDQPLPWHILSVIRKWTFNQG